MTDVRKSGEMIFHQLGRPRPTNAPPLAPGDEISGEIDWERRYRHMRLHTAQHFVSAVVFARTGRRTRAASMKGERAAIELEGTLPARADWAALKEAILSELRTPGPSRSSSSHARNGTATLPSAPASSRSLRRSIRSVYW